MKSKGKKSKSKKKFCCNASLDKLRMNSWHRCYDCQIKLGGKPPWGGLIAVTVTKGCCPTCGKRKTLIPNCDFGWGNVKAVFD